MDSLAFENAGAGNLAGDEPTFMRKTTSMSLEVTSVLSREGLAHAVFVSWNAKSNRKDGKAEAGEPSIHT